MYYMYFVGMEVCTHRSQKGALDCPELDLQIGVNCHDGARNQPDLWKE